MAINEKELLKFLRSIEISESYEILNLTWADQEITIYPFYEILTQEQNIYKIPWILII